MEVLNLGILAHVDAGKTTLTERLLFAAGTIAVLGSVDHGTTQTDSLALERRRGITIKTAVASLTTGDTTINLIDTPGHPDFIAEVERALGVLDGAVLVVSAVEGVQVQTRLLFRALRRLGLPAVVFVNKVDLPRASLDRTVDAIAARLTSACVQMGSVRDEGTRSAAFEPWARAHEPSTVLRALAEHDDGLLESYVGGRRVDPVVLDRSLRAQSRGGLVVPIFAGSAVTGAGVDEFTRGLANLLPPAPMDDDGALSARVFKVERTRSGRRVGHVRVFRGALHVRERVSVAGDAAGTVTELDTYESGAYRSADRLGAGRLGRVAGLDGVRVGDWLGSPMPERGSFHFPPPSFESVVEPVRAQDGAALRSALRQLADQDPLIGLGRDVGQEATVLLYGEVQGEVIAATLAEEFGIEVVLRAPSLVCVERPRRTGAAVELLRDRANPVSATVGLRVEPAAPGSGRSFRMEIEAVAVPTYIYKTIESFVESMTSHVAEALEVGLSGWPVTDCTVALTACEYYVGDGRVPLGTTRTTAADFRHLTPVVLRQALLVAGTIVCEPLVRATIEVPRARLSAALALVARLAGTITDSAPSGELVVVDATLRAAVLPELQRRLTGVTGGEAVVESTPAGFRPVRGAAPTRASLGGDR